MSKRIEIEVPDEAVDTLPDGYEIVGHRNTKEVHLWWSGSEWLNGNNDLGSYLIATRKKRSAADVVREMESGTVFLYNGGAYRAYEKFVFVMGSGTEYGPEAFSGTEDDITILTPEGE